MEKYLNEWRCVNFDQISMYFISLNYLFQQALETNEFQEIFKISESFLNLL